MFGAPDNTHSQGVEASQLLFMKLQDSNGSKPRHTSHNPEKADISTANIS